MKSLLWIIFFLFNFNINIFSDGAKILAPISFAGKSHMHFFYPILHELAKRGHEVTVIAPFSSKFKHNNYKEIVFDDVEKQFFEKHNSNDLREEHKGLGVLSLITKYSTTFCEIILEDPRVQSIINGNDKFDLIFMSAFFNECQLGWLHLNKDAHLVQSASFGGWNWMMDVYGSPQEIATSPEILLGYTQNMNLLQRTNNLLIGIFWKIFREFYFVPLHQEIINKHFGTDSPPIQQLEQKSSLLILNTEISLGLSRSYSNNIITAGGLHLSDPEPLPSDLQKWMNEAKHGVIYFSLGSAMKSADLPKHKLKELINTFKNLKQRVIWKWETDNLPEQPENVRIGKWWPQKDLLAHPKIVLFITHGGLLSTQEAVYHGVPLIGIPLMADQDLNMANVEEKGFGIKITLENVTENSLHWALDQVITKTSYRKNAKHFSSLFRDQLVKPLDKAVFWIEYVLRHNGAHHLNNSGRNLYWFQRELFDVYLFIAIIISIILWIITKIIKSVVRCFKKSTPITKTSNKKSKKA